jgi:hypothetical protein
LSEKLGGRWVEEENASYFTDDLTDAVGTALAMWGHR